MEKSIGPINSIVLARAGGSDKIYKKDQNSIELNGLCELMISENQFMNFNDRVDYLQELSDRLFGVEYYLNDFVSTGIMYYDLLDMYNVEIFGKTYNCLMLNDEQNITQGLEENIHTDRPETSETDYKKADITDRKINQTYLLVDKQNQKIEGVISQIGDRSEKTTTITADIDGINSKVEQFADLTNTVSGVKTITLENCAEGELYELHIFGNNTVFDTLYPRDTLYPSDTLYPGGESYIAVRNNKTGSEEVETTIYELGVTDVLRQKNNVYDEYVLKDGKAQVIRRINKDGSIKDNEEIENLGEYTIYLKDGTNEIEILNYSAQLEAKWIIKNDLTDTFVPNVSLGTKITQNSTSVQIAWNQISEFIQFMALNNNAVLAILDENQNVLMTLEKNGQYFYDTSSGKVFGEMGVHYEKKENSNDEDRYISFGVQGEYDSEIANGMAWGITTSSDKKFHPILYIKNFKMSKKESDASHGELVLSSCDIVLDGIGTGLKSGEIKLIGDPQGGAFYFYDTARNEYIMSIEKATSVSGDNINILNKLIVTNDNINILNKLVVTENTINILDRIYFFANKAGSNSFKVGNSSYCLMTDSGDISCSNSLNVNNRAIIDSNSVFLGTNSNHVSFSVYSTSATIHSNLSVRGKVYADNISSDRKIKKNIKESDIKATEIIKKIKHRQFERKDDGKHYDTGYIAQEMEEIDPNFVLINYEKDKKEKKYYINELPILATATKAIQELTAKVEELQKEIKELKEKEEN